MPVKTSTPLRYPGGKAKLINYTTSLITQNNYLGCTYVEPFAGGAGLAIQLLFNGIVNRLILNDKDRSVYALWHSILHQPDELIDLLLNTDITIDSWHMQKDVQLRKDTENLLSLGFSTLFLNRTNRSGILNAGPIGGKKQNGNFKLDCRFDKQDIINRIRKITQVSHLIEFYNHDAIYFIENIINPITDRVFIFFDPPYHIQGPGLYLNHYKDDGHRMLSTIISNVQHPWIVTYDNTPLINELYSNFTCTTYQLNYSAQNPQKGTELMIYSGNINPLPIVIAH